MTSSLMLCLALTLPGADPQLTPAKQAAVAAVDERAAMITDLGKKVWEFAELAFQEHKSSALLADALEREGFKVTRGVATMPTAFVAEYGSGKPVVAILAEYDALPGLSQAAVPQQQPLPTSRAGHGCGHNLFGAASTGAALAVKHVLADRKLSGTVRLYGCPAEEGGSGKVYLVREGLMKDVDVAFHWHPGSGNSAAMKSSLAVIRFRVRFTGKAAHAAGSPQKGRSALDGIELMNVGVNYLREHVPTDSRIHYVITNGGGRPNIVPEHAESWYYIRSPKMTDAALIFERVKKIAQGAALMSETQQEVHMVTGSYEILENEPLAKLMDANLRAIGAPQFTDDEIKFATELRQNIGVNEGRDTTLGALDTTIGNFTSDVTNGSTDVGDVSWVVPTTGLSIATSARGVPGHSWSTVACAGSPIGTRGSIVAAKVLATTTLDIFEQPERVAAAKADFERRKGTVVYKVLLPPGPAPTRLDDLN
ncbi:MAG: amidohydrolase [Planctomycetaceae bacterium]|nr:amidohydrolase [Planctomycetaceae bacterium]